MDGDGSDADATPHMEDAKPCRVHAAVIACVVIAVSGSKRIGYGFVLDKSTTIGSYDHHYHRCGFLFTIFFNFFI